MRWVLGIKNVPDTTRTEQEEENSKWDDTYTQIKELKEEINKEKEIWGYSAENGIYCVCLEETSNIFFSFRGTVFKK